MNSVELRAVGKRSLEWDLNDWKWDGDLFLASSLNSVPPGTFSRQIFSNGTIPVTGGLSDSSSSCSDDVTMGIEKRKNEIEKRRRITGMEDRALNDESGGPILKLGSHGYQIPEREVGSWEGSSGKKTKFVGGSSNRAICQVEDCGADLSRAKDYHRRHKVCEMHSKASRALVGNLMQRFCQQCSRFHALQEFDEGKRSCRRRLAGHNKRRRKTNPESAANGSSPNEDQTSGYLLMSLLRILSNMHSNQSDHSADQDLISHLLRSIAGQNSEHKERDIPVHLQEPQNLQNGRLVGNSELVSTSLSNGAQGPSMPSEQHTPLPLSEMPLQDVSPHDSRSGDTKTISSVKHGTMNSSPAYSELVDCTAVKSKMNNFDLNDIYIDSDDGIEDVETSVLPVHLGTSSLESPWARQDSHQSSPPQTSGNSDSASAQSPSSSSGEAQSRTDRIVIKLFGKDPSEFPLDLRAQVLDWLAHSPTDMESYIKPGCVVLTIYLRQTEEAWEELCYDICCSLNRLLQGSDDTFWRTGWVYARIQHHLAFAFHGQVMVDTSLSLRSSHYCNIVSVKPIAVSASERIRFSVRGSNLKRPGTRLLCALEGKYLTEKATQEATDTEKATQESTDTDSMKEHDDRNELEFISFSCSIPVVNGRGFIEAEDHGFSSSFFPFIVAEDDVCSDIRVLEATLELTDTSSDATGVTVTEARRQAMDFIHEMGWLLRRKQLNSRLKIMNSNADTYSLDRFKWLMEFSMNRDWCAVVRKLLNILFDGIVSIGDHPSLNEALFEMSLLHRAVRRGSKSLVEVLLRFKPQKVTTENEVVDGFLFRPDSAGPAGLTPLHIAAAKDGSEDVLDALTDDPGMVGIEAWRNARDSTGSTPEDYARLRGHFSYIHLIQKKINKRASSGHVVLDIPSVVHSDHSTNEKQTDNLGSAFEIRLTRPRPNCRVCDKKLSYGKLRPSHSLVYRPAMLSMVAIAAVCVCVALLFKSSPEVLYVFGPFRWDLLDYGTC